MADGKYTRDLAQGGGPNDEAKIGRRLEQKRKERDLSLEEVEQATKIRKRYLEGLEREDYAVLPDGVYAQGFLKTYANYLGLDGDALSGQLKSRRKPRRERGIKYNTEPEDGFGEPLIAPTGLQGTEKRKFPTATVVTLLVAVLVLAAVIGALYFVGRGVEASRSENNPPRAEHPLHKGQQKVANKEKAAAPAEEAGRQARAEDRQGVPPDVLRVLISVRERPSWLYIRADGTPAYEQVAEPGFSQSFQADRRLYIKAGDAGAVTVEVNGQDAGTLGRTGYIVDKTYTLKRSS